MRERGSERAVCGARLAAPGGAQLAVQLAVRWATPAACCKYCGASRGGGSPQGILEALLIRCSAAPVPARPGGSGAL